MFLVRDDLALVQTVDFFTPIVDDPYDFGRIAAANALSDVYAMGGTPLTALNITAFPVDDLDLDILARILEGGAAIAREAGVTIVGGHTIKDAEPKYGMAVTGTLDPQRIVTNAGARPGDILVLTKPVGTGIFATALKRELIAEAAMAPVVASMTRLNAHAARAMLDAGAIGATDVTGFGLLGHAGGMMRASGVRLVIFADQVPLHAGLLELIERGAVPGGTRDNAAEHARYTRFAFDIPDALAIALSDAQTSGGLLIAVAPEKLDALRDALRAGGDLAAVIGRVEEGTGISVELATHA